MTVVTRHIGRLGNNMFQIAASIGYARKYGYEWGVDPSAGHGEPYSAIHKVFPNLPKAEMGGGIRYHEHPNQFCDHHGKHFNECHFDYHDIPNLGPNVTLTGFYQSWKYFEHCKEEVKKVFSLPHIEGYEDYVSIHVRRGDYVQHAGSFPPITFDYIIKALENVLVLRDFKKALIFSDDIEYCKTTLLQNQNDLTESYKTVFGRPIEFLAPGNELESLSRMASCGHHIIANSSFSWWGAYLGHNPDRIVVSPSAQTWFGPTAGVKSPVVDLIPSNWIQIHTR